VFASLYVAHKRVTYVQRIEIARGTVFDGDATVRVRAIGGEIPNPLVVAYRASRGAADAKTGRR